ncbi:type II toxin-antitoxin system VapC family toxin [Mitsuaria sp. GD03876]|uniref:type II toxin-antitoxin system VapC family toxin n=1 Tax=Mitsuaria sp. GD03876 TaxID=2975399 RepID=UPI00244936CD|nr:type II toxin-antitoxin system VapC family toxin [Mitsuaria sp. GD03876]MDH0863781.1 type II toxin-antitoxin system VapC family toxin [Mitsuaria sp. GD03876]
MTLLLDTHIFLWAVEESDRLKASTRRLIESADVVFISAVSIWELAIKAGLGKLKADPDELVEAIEECGFRELPVSAEHAATVMVLALHHRDPFDRMLIAQAISEAAHLVTADEHLPQYSELILQV